MYPYHAMPKLSRALGALSNGKAPKDCEWLKQESDQNS